MGVLAKPVIAVLYAKRELLEIFLSELPVEALSEPFYFQNLQRYYSQEMGEGLYKLFLSLKALIRREDLIEFKLWAMEKERLYSCKGRRKLNIDPGYVDESHLVLASSKKRGGRVYLGKGVFGEMEYLYLYGGYRPLYWTYGDYRNKGVKDFFERVRERFLEQLNLARKGKELVVYRFGEDELYEEVQTWGTVSEVKSQT